MKKMTPWGNEQRWPYLDPEDRYHVANACYDYVWDLVCPGASARGWIHSRNWEFTLDKNLF
jgi:hypothetical protein